MVQRFDISAGTGTATDACGNVLQNLSQSAVSSMEQFISPVKIQKGHPESAETPGFRPPEVSNETGNYGDGAVGPTLHELDPYFPQGVIEGDDGSQFMKQNDYRIVANSSLNTEDGDFNIRKYEDAGSDRADISVVQPMNALRGPIIVSGWGFGMDDLPMPQKGAAFPDNTSFHQDMASNRALWKTGPVHLMWDEERQVWQGGYPIVCGVVDGAITAPIDVCSPTFFTVNLFRNTHPGAFQNLSDRISNDDVPKEFITVSNRDPSLEQEDTPNAIFCIAIKLNYEWLPLWVGCPEKPACGDTSKGQPPKPTCIKNDTCP